MLAAPRFWAEPPGKLAGLLSPVAAAWAGVGRLQQALIRPYCAPVPVLCVGNLVAGGAGKTPVALALASHLRARGVEVHLVTRGYGGCARGPLLIDPARHDAATVGDEALLLARRAPSWVARDRAAGVRAAAATGAEVVVLDDGLQNPTIAKTLSILVVDAGYGFGNGRVIPAGPLREKLTRGLAKADAAVLLATQGEAGSAALTRVDKRLKTFPAMLRPVDGERLTGSHVIAFAGIGRPQKFFSTLRGLGAVLARARVFPDHHPYSVAEIEQLLYDAGQSGARLVTTAKDIVRVPLPHRARIEVLEVEISWAEPGALDELLDPLLAASQPDVREAREPPLLHCPPTSLLAQVREA
jgi:tetraacyldisaccharide 4'-kinase